MSYAPPETDNATTAACAKVQEQLPVSLLKLAPRVVHTQFAVAWGDPAIVLRCGVARPNALHPGSSVQFFDGGEISGPYFDITRDGDANVYTTVDRPVYLAIVVPGKYQGASVITPLAADIAKALPSVCNPGPSGANLCDRRK